MRVRQNREEKEKEGGEGKGNKEERRKGWRERGRLVGYIKKEEEKKID